MATLVYDGREYRLIDDSMTRHIKAQLDAIRDGRGEGVITFQGVPAGGDGLQDVQILIEPDTSVAIVG